MLNLKYLNIALITIVFSLSSNQVLGSEYFRPCFKTKNNSLVAQNKISFIKAPNDKIRVDRNCLEIYTTDSRKSLYIKYLELNFKGHYILKEAQVSSESCRLFLIKKVRSQFNNVLLATSKVSKAKAINQNNSTSSMTTILIQNNYKSKLTIDKNNISIHCSKTNTGYNLDIDSLDKEISFSTSLFLQYGMSYSLTEVLRTINDKKTSLGNKRGIGYTTSKGQSSISYTIKAANEL